MNSVMGMVYLFASNFAPVGFAPCDGRLLRIQDNIPLFSLVGTLYGGDGTTTFALPKLDAPAPELRYVIAVDGMFPSRP